MNVKKQSDPRQEQSLLILESLCRHCHTVTSDMLYASLEDAGFSVDERVRYVGGCFATAKSKARKWLTKTHYTLNSARNRGCPMRVWVSNIFGHYEDGRVIDEKTIVEEYSRIQRKLGVVIPDDLGKAFVLQNSLSSLAKQSAPTPYVSAYGFSPSQKGPAVRGDLNKLPPRPVKGQIV